MLLNCGTQTFHRISCQQHQNYSVAAHPSRSGAARQVHGRCSTALKATEERPTGTEPEESLSGLADAAKQATEGQKKRRRTSDSSDFISSALTRRFGLAGGLAYVGFLTFGVVSEQFKTRREVSEEASGTQDVQDAPEVTLPSGVRYKDLRIGGGTPVQKGFLVVLDYQGTTGSEVFEDTQKRGKPIVFVSGSRPFTGGLCIGAEEGLAGMRGGGRRRVTVPADRGFGPKFGVG
ncbi:hypothetical protein WJX74_009971 [Apatococcus lobatus]|uniref:peptidylprolyl isomerase n=2 Tax=Apatococcus TaxID=904362 RepID=A0AAW1RDJ5_9CHLO